MRISFSSVKKSLLLIALLCFGLCLYCSILSAQPKPTAAVMDLEAQKGIDQLTAKTLSDSLRSSLHKGGFYRLLTRENMEAILKEQTFQLSGCTSQECVVKVGRLLGAQKIFSGTIGKVGSTYVVTLKLFDIETGEIERIEEDRCSGCAEDSLLDSVDRLSAKICNLPIPTTPTQVQTPTPTQISTKEITPKDNSQMVLIPEGEFLMGSPKGEKDERPQHKVFLDAYYIDKYEVTVSQYQKFCQELGRKMPIQPDWSSNKHPVVNVSWADATAYAQYYGKRLPTEAEWEKACRAGSTTRYCFGDAEADLKDYAWYSVNSNRQTHPVGTKKPNAFGIYDMHGNAWEWCSDRYAGDYYKNSPTNNPKGPVSGRDRVLRGGSWGVAAGDCRSAGRGWNNPANLGDGYGFRCASSPDTQ